MDHDKAKEEYAHYMLYKKRDKLFYHEHGMSIILFSVVMVHMLCSISLLCCGSPYKGNHFKYRCYASAKALTWEDSELRLHFCFIVIC